MSKVVKEFIFKSNINFFYLRESFILFFKFLLLSVYSKEVKRNAFRYIFFNFVSKKSLRCLLTGRSKGVNSTLCLSRIVLRKFIGEGLLFGFKNSS